LRWSFEKWIPGMFCTKVDEPTDSNGWDDNFLCSTRDLGLRWSSLGPISGMVCTQFEETSDPTAGVTTTSAPRKTTDSSGQ